MAIILRMKRIPLWILIAAMTLIVLGRNYIMVPPKAIGEWLANHHAVQFGLPIPTAHYDGPIAGAVAGIVPIQETHPNSRCVD